jgi:RNA polymerase sigma-70 factor (ECF subfamily)
LLGRDPLANPEPLVRRVYSYVAYRIGDGPDAEDVTSAVFEAAVRYRDTYDASKGKPVTWLLGIARRCVAQELVGRSETVSEPPEPQAPGDLEFETIERLTLEAALNSLSERERDLLALRYGADLRVRQIAEIVGLTTNAAEVALHRALGRLRAELESPESGGGTEPVLGPVDRPA